MSHFCVKCNCYVCESYLEAPLQPRPSEFLVLTHIPNVFPSMRLDAEDGCTLVCGGCELKHNGARTVLGVVANGQPRVFTRTITWAERVPAVNRPALSAERPNQHRVVAELHTLVSQLRHQMGVVDGAA